MPLTPSDCLLLLCQSRLPHESPMLGKEFAGFPCHECLQERLLSNASKIEEYVLAFSERVQVSRWLELHMIKEMSTTGQDLRGDAGLASTTSGEPLVAWITLCECLPMRSECTTLCA